MNSTVETQACIKEDFMFQRVYYLLKHVLLEKTSIFPALPTVLSYETCIDNYILDSVILFHLNISLKKVQSVFQILMDLPNLMKILIFL